MHAFCAQVWWVWYLWISPVFWSLYGLVVTQLGDLTDTMVLQNGTVTQVSLHSLPTVTIPPPYCRRAGSVYALLCSRHFGECDMSGP